MQGVALTDETVPGGGRRAARAAEAQAGPGRSGLSAVRVREASGAAARRRRRASSNERWKRRRRCGAPRRRVRVRRWPLAALHAAARPGVQADRRTSSPVYEGWLPNADGSFSLVFGYINREWDEETSRAARRRATPSSRAGPDHGQPTHFFPRRNRFVFTVRVPKDFGTKELVWTLTSKGRTEKAYGTLQARLRARRHRRSCRTSAPAARSSTTPDMVGNKAPALSVEGTKKPHRESRRAGRARRDRDRRWEAEQAEHAGAAWAASYTLPQSGQRPAPVVLRLSRPRRSGHVRSAADEGVGGHARRRRLAVVGGLRDAAGSGREQVAGRARRSPSPARTSSARSRTTAGSGHVSRHHRRRRQIGRRTTEITALSTPTRSVCWHGRNLECSC